MALAIIKNLPMGGKMFWGMWYSHSDTSEIQKILSFHEEVEKSEKQTKTKPQQAKNNNWNNACIFGAVILKFWLM